MLNCGWQPFKWIKDANATQTPTQLLCEPARRVGTYLLVRVAAFARGGLNRHHHIGDVSLVVSTPRPPFPASPHLLALQLKPSLPGLRTPECPLPFGLFESRWRDEDARDRSLIGRGVVLTTPPFVGTFCKSVDAQSTALPWHTDPLAPQEEYDPIIAWFDWFVGNWSSQWHSWSGPTKGPELGSQSGRPFVVETKEAVQVWTLRQSKAYRD